MMKIICSLIFLFFVNFISHGQIKDTSIQRHSSIIQFTVQQRDTAIMTVYNMLGKYVAQKSFSKSSSYRLSLNSFYLPAGIYLVRIKTSLHSVVKKAFVMP